MITAFVINNRGLHGPEFSVPAAAIFWPGPISSFFIDPARSVMASCYYSPAQPELAGLRSHGRAVSPVQWAVPFSVKKRALPWNSVKCVIFTNFNTFGFICESLQTVINMFLYRFCEIFKDSEGMNRAAVMTSCIRRWLTLTKWWQTCNVFELWSILLVNGYMLAWNKG